MITISLCMIVKNEEDTLGRCLESIKDVVDEIIIVDTGSSDSTKEVSRGFRAQIYDFEWVDDFSVARNYSFSKATMNYILWLDADDVVLAEDAFKLSQLKSSLNPDTDIVMMKYNTGFDENGQVTFSFVRSRLLRRANNYKWQEAVHEYIQPSGKIINADIGITHKKVRTSSSDRNLKIFEKTITKGNSLSPRSQFYYARELYYHKRYDDAISFFNKFLDEDNGWVEDKISACYHLAICYSSIKQNKKCLQSLIKSFEYSSPRAEIICRIGLYYMDMKDYEKAIDWYLLATKLNKPSNMMGFVLHDCWEFVPNIQLCLCYDKLGNTNEAIKYNLKAAEYKPNDAAVLHNIKYFSSVMDVKDKSNK